MTTLGLVAQHAVARRTTRHMTVRSPTFPLGPSDTTPGMTFPRRVLPLSDLDRSCLCRFASML